MNESKNTTYQNLGKSSKSVLRGKCIAVNIYIYIYIKEERS